MTDAETIAVLKDALREIIAFHDEYYADEDTDPFNEGLNFGLVTPRNIAFDALEKTK